MMEENNESNHVETGNPLERQPRTRTNSMGVVTPKTKTDEKITNEQPRESKTVRIEYIKDGIWILVGKEVPRDKGK